MNPVEDPRVAALSRCARHAFSKRPEPALRLLAGHGVEGDAHAGSTVRHRSRVAVDPTQPNLRQVHLLGSELLEELAASGYDVGPGRLGENVLTSEIDLHALPVGTRLILGPSAEIELTGLRNPCRQLDEIGPGLMRRLAWRDGEGRLVRRAGVMAVVVSSGVVRVGDGIRVRLSPGPRRPLAVV